MIIKFTYAKYFPLYLLFIGILLIAHGKGTGTHYLVSPYFILISLFIIATTSKNIYKGILKPIIFFVVLTVISSINFIYFSNTEISYIQYLSYSTSVYLVTLALYAFIYKNPESIKVIKIFILLFFIIGIYRYFRSEKLIEEGIYEKLSRQNNAFYHVLMPLPLLFLFKNKLIKIAALILAFAICVLSVKRSAIIAISLISLVFIYYNYIKGEKKIQSYFIIIVVLLVVINMFDLFIVFERFNVLSERFDSIQDDGGSGRVAILERFFKQDIYDLFKFPEILIGNGYSGYNNKYPALDSSHNDWTETLYSFGVLGLICLASFFILILKKVKLLVSERSPIRVGYISAFILFVFYSLVGGNFFFFHTSIILFSFIGISEAMYNNKINEF